MSKILDRVITYLKSMQLTYEIRPVEGKFDRIMVPYTISDEDLEFNVFIDVSKQFLRFWVLIMPHEVVQSKKRREDLYRELLLANGKLAEIKYFVTEKGDVGIVGHEGVKVLTINGFREEFRALPYGIIHFLTVIAKKLGLHFKFPDSGDHSIYS
ncbi:MAG: hypothetical protein Q6361_06290 [Candidatus Hermodarchaeota archaeon]|nr:hypothetical protein [Candidatus Hermodarchaeota archaeon]